VSQEWRRKVIGTPQIPVTIYRAEYPERARPQAAYHHSSPVRSVADARVETRSMRDEEHLKCGRGSEKAPTRAPTPAPPVQSAPIAQSVLAPRRHANVQAGAHECGSTLRIRANGWRREAVAKGCQGACNLQPEDARARRSCRGRSTIASIMLKLIKKVAQDHNGFARRRTNGGDQRRS